MNHRKKAAQVALALGLAISFQSYAAEPRQATREEQMAYIVAQKLKSEYPATNFASVKPTPMDGIYEVVMGKRIVYTNADAKLLIFGRIVDLKAQRDLTQDRMAEITAIDPKTLPTDLAIKTVRGNGSRVLYVFSDPDCPYCRKLETSLKEMTNVTIYTFLYPLEGIHPEAPEHASAIWCAKDKSKTWIDHMVNGKAAKPAKCDTPLEKIGSLGKSLNVQGTPMLINSKGRTQAGAMALAELEDFASEK